MNTMENNVKVWFDNNHIFVRDAAGNTGSSPLSKFPKLLQVAEKERLEYELSPFGIHWPKLDEDLSFEGFKQQHKLTHK